MALLDQPEQGYIEPATVSPRPTGMRWGFIMGLVSVALSLLWHITGMVDFTQQQSMFSLPNAINWAVTLGLFYYAFTQHRDNELGGYMTLGRAMGLGFWITLVSGIITAIYLYFFLTYMMPDFASTMLDNAAEQAEKRGQDPEVARQQMEKMSWMFSPAFFGVFAILGSLFFGVIFSLIVGLVVRRESPRPF
jgi:hypothetical protein